MLHPDSLVDHVDQLSFRTELVSQYVIRWGRDFTMTEKLWKTDFEFCSVTYIPTFQVSTTTCSDRGLYVYSETDAILAKRA